MGYNLSALPDFKSEGKAFVIKSILESQTIKKLNDAGSFDPTAKGTQTIQLLDSDLVIQDGSNCGFSSAGGAILSQTTLTVKDLKINEEYCPRDLERVWAKGELKAGQEYDEMVFMSDIADMNTKKAALELEKMVWLGDTTITGTTSLKRIDGYIKQIKAGAYINLSGATGTTVIAKLQKVNASMPIEVRSAEDFRIFIGKDTFDQYVAELAEKNLFNQPESGTVFGTTAKYEVLNGLNGGHVVAARYRNLQAGGEMTDVSYESWYSKDDDNLKVKSRFSLGVVPVYVQEIGYAKVA
ncbi:hypothetical protein [Mucilaginibacter psychrotolerans]|uniref:Phage major capsid protein n=1 Tax=Mucilaginibacter psychrotolerans TaxID=1524096 RepID=A0A4Y8S6K4_9SPHI|nr:hypothetical protein [Mucilaginibacter psychrotolerans]TFF34386.1 hypothetical protein E2R66_22185 [Mucilaginibacter psychrotolerans]